MSVNKYKIVRPTTDQHIDIPIEIKKSTSPDWMQCSLKYDNNTNKWIGSLKNI